MRQPHDTQRSKVYHWEATNLQPEWGLLEAVDHQPLGEQGAQDLVRKIWREHCPELGTMPRVRVMGNRNRGMAVRELIKLSSKYPASQAPWYVIHELTHSILDDRKEKVAWHGPEFCALYAYLLGQYTAAHSGSVRSSMRGAGLKISCAQKS